MKITTLWICIFLLSYQIICAQKDTHSSLQLEHFYGSIIKHKPKIAHLAISHPQGFSLSYNKKTTQKDSALANYNYPEYGATFTYHDFKNHILGKSYALQFHYNFYFGNRNNNNLFYLKLAQGLAYISNPFDLETNNKNVALGSHLNGNVSLGFNYKRKNIFKGFDAILGLYFSHYSNGSIKPPNTGINILSLSTGINYNFDYKNPINYQEISNVVKIQKQEPIRYNLQFIAGVNSTGNLQNKQFPYYVFSAYADKRINNKSIINIGTEVFFSNFLKELIQYNAVAFPEKPNEDGTADYKRVSLIVGHELDINKIAIITQLGYYIYYPYKYETRVYERIGIKRYFGKHFFASLSLKAHVFVAESIDLGIGIRL